MKQIICLALLFVFSLLPINIFAYVKLAIKNDDGITIYYNVKGDNELEVTVENYGEYEGNITIPKEVIYRNKTYKVTSIGGSAFNSCYYLTSVNIPNSVTSIGDGAFSGCNRLTSIIIPNHVASIGYSSFKNCSSLTSISIPEGVSAIGDYVFAGCSKLTSITIPNSVVSIGYDAFKNTAWYDNQPDGIVYAGKVAYKYKGTMPDNTDIEINEGTLGIASQAFDKCKGLSSVTIPNSVVSIGYDAFRNTAWYDNQPDGIVYAGKVAYKYKGIMPENTYIEIHDGTISISAYAFSGCKGLKTIKVPNSVTYIGHGAFLNEE